MRMNGLPVSQPEFLTVLNPDAARIPATHPQPFQTRLRKNLAKSDDRPHYPDFLTLLPATYHLPTPLSHDTRTLSPRQRLEGYAYQVI